MVECHPHAQRGGGGGGRKQEEGGRRERRGKAGAEERRGTDRFLRGERQMGGRGEP